MKYDLDLFALKQSITGNKITFIAPPLALFSALLIGGNCLLLRERSPLQVGSRRLFAVRGLHEVLGVGRFEPVGEREVSGEVDHFQLAVRTRRPDVVQFARETRQ